METFELNEGGTFMDTVHESTHLLGKSVQSRAIVKFQVEVYDDSVVVEIVRVRRSEIVCGRWWV